MTRPRFEAMTADQQHAYVQRFARDFRELVWKYAGKNFNAANDSGLLSRMQDTTSCFQPWIWP